MAQTLIGVAASFHIYLQKMKHTYTFIGLQEFYHLSMTILLKALKKTYKIVPPKNVTIANNKNQFEISYKTYNALLDKHSLDIRMYEYLFENYARLSERFFVYQHQQNNSNK